MSGPFTNTIEQLVEQVNWLQTDQGITWDNIRYGFSGSSTDGTGAKWVPYSSPFPRELLGVSATLDFSGGVRNWEMGIRNVGRDGFTAQIGLASGFGGPVVGIVGIFYLAWGR